MTVGTFEICLQAGLELHIAECCEYPYWVEILVIGHDKWEESLSESDAL